MMLSPSRRVHRILRSLGWHVQRWRDPYVEAAALLRGQQVTHVVDGGAYHGGTTSHLLAMFPQATVHAFEPQAESFAFLHRQFADHPRVRLYHCALSDEVGRGMLHVNRQGFQTSLLATTETAVMEPVGTQDVATTTLDAWAAEQGVAAPQMIKLDLQGHELAALRGASGLLTDGVKIVHAEVNFRSRYAGSCLFHDVASFLDELDFRLYRLYEIMNGPDGAWQQADALFTHARVFERHRPSDI